MKDKLAFYQVLDYYLSTKNWEALKGKYIAVEIPETKEMYYVSVDLEGEEQRSLNIQLVKGNLGLDYLMLTLDSQIEPIDIVERRQYINITIDAPFKTSPEEFSAEVFETYSELYVVSKSKAGLSRPINALEIKDLTTIFEVLSQVPVKSLKKIKRITKKTTFETLFKKDDRWQREQRKVVFDYEKVKYSDLEMYPLIKDTDLIDETWYVFSVFTSELASVEPLAKESSADTFKGGAYLIDSTGSLLQSLDFVGASKEIDTIKKIIVKGLKEDQIRPQKIVFHLRSLYIALKDFLEALGIKALYQPGNEVVEDYIKKYIRGEGFESQIMDRQVFIEMVMTCFFEAKGIDPNHLNDLPFEVLDALMKELEEIVNELTIATEKDLTNIPKLQKLSKEALREFLIDYILKGIDDAVEVSK